MIRSDTAGAARATDWRLPGEFEPQLALIIAWPHRGTDWADVIDAIRQEIIALIQAVLAHEPVVLLIDPADTDPLPNGLARSPKLYVVDVPFDDTWCRDYAPITLVQAHQRRLLDFQFNGWGKYPAHSNDNAVTAALVQHPVFRKVVSSIQHMPSAWVLEGGAIESNGHGTILVNMHCLRTRLPELSPDSIVEALKTHLKAHQVLAIDVPPLPGDDTDGHIDTLVRFVDEQTLLVQKHPNPAAHQALMDQISAFSIDRPEGAVKPRLFELPCPSYPDQGPKNYANFVLINGAVLVPQYGGPNDQAACAVMKKALPKRAVIPVDASIMVTQLGGPHCATMHIPHTDQPSTSLDG